MSIGKRVEDKKGSAGSYRYGFNGKEKDADGEWGGNTHYDYGARIYNPAIGKFLSIDPLTREFPDYTPYHYVHNNPLALTDPTGMKADSIIVNDITYKPGQAYDGDDEFVASAFEALDYMRETGADDKGLIDDLANSSERDVTIIELTDKNNPFYPAPAFHSSNDFDETSGGTIYWKPDIAAKFWEPNGLPFSLFTSQVGYRSPSEILFHEIGHSHSQAFSFSLFYQNTMIHKFGANHPDRKWTNQEEFNNINNNENVAGQILRPGSLNRSSHSLNLRFFPVLSVTSIK